MLIVIILTYMITDIVMLTYIVSNIMDIKDKLGRR